MLPKPLLRLEEVTNEMSEFMGVIFHFDDVSLRATIWAGDRAVWPRA